MTTPDIDRPQPDAYTRPMPSEPHHQVPGGSAARVDDDTVVQRHVLTAAALAAFLSPFMGSAVNVALPALAHDFSLDAVTLSWVQTSYLLVSAVLLLPCGRLADIHGRKRVFIWGTLIFVLGAVLSGLAHSAWMLIAGRLVQGVGSAMTFATGLAIITSVFPPDKRGRAIGITVGVVYVGLSAGPFLGGILTVHLGWRSVFLAPIPVGLAAVWMIVSRVRGEWAEAAGERFDLIGSILYGVGIAALVYGLTELPDPDSWWLLGAGVLLMALFVRWEIFTKSPVFEIDLFRHNRVFGFSNLAALINYADTFAVTFLLSLYLQYIKGQSPQGTGLILVVQPVIMAVVSPWAGRLSDRVQPRLLASLGMGLTVVGLGLLAALHRSTPLWYIVADLVILGVGFGLFSSPNMSAIMGAVERKHYGIAAGAVSSMRLLGQMLSMGLAAMALSLFIGPVRITPAAFARFMEAVRVTFVVFALMGVGGVFCSLARGRMPAAAGRG
jgi:EmrB/QacA subfamily drug resistance transporter